MKNEVLSMKTFFYNLFSFLKKAILYIINISILILLVEVQIGLTKYEIQNKYDYFNSKFNVLYLLIGCTLLTIIMMYYYSSKWLSLLNIINLSWLDVLKSIRLDREIIDSKLAIFVRIRTYQEKYNKLIEWLSQDNIMFTSDKIEILVNRCKNFVDLQEQYLVEKEILVETVTYTYWNNVINVLGCLAVGVVFLITVYKYKDSYLTITTETNIGENFFSFTQIRIGKMLGLVFGFTYFDGNIDDTLPGDFIPPRGRDQIQMLEAPNLDLDVD